MNQYQNEPLESIVAETCPSCGAHLEDTWNGEECERCGFQYLADAGEGEQRDRYRQNINPGPSTFAATVAVQLAVFGGALLASTEPIFETTTAPIIEVPVPAVSGTAALIGVGLLVAAMLVIVASAMNRYPAVNGGGSR